MEPHARAAARAARTARAATPNARMPHTAPPVRDEYRELLDFLPDVYLVTDAAGVIREANRAVSALIGYARLYAIGKPLLSLVHPPDSAAVQARLARAVARPDARVVTFATRFRVRRRGAPVDVRVWLAPIRDAAGALVGLRWLVRDVTAETRTAALLRDAEATHARDLRTRTMELEATVRMARAQLAGRAEAAGMPPAAP